MWLTNSAPTRTAPSLFSGVHSRYLDLSRAQSYFRSSHFSSSYPCGPFWIVLIISNLPIFRQPLRLDSENASVIGRVDSRGIKSDWLKAVWQTPTLPALNIHRPNPSRSRMMRLTIYRRRNGRRKG